MYAKTKFKDVGHFHLPDWPEGNRFVDSERCTFIPLSVVCPADESCYCSGAAHACEVDTLHNDVFEGIRAHFRPTAAPALTSDAVASPGDIAPSRFPQGGTPNTSVTDRTMRYEWRA